MPQRVVIFTVGFHARATFRWLQRQPDRRVVAFVDNNPAVLGRPLYGVPVLPPGALATIAYDLVALPGRNQAPIRAQLQNQLGVPADRIWIVRKSEVPPAPDELARRGAALAGLLDRTLAVLASAGVRHWAMHSSLLGLVRGDDLALFSDFDLCVDAAGFDALTERFSHGFGLQPIAHRSSGPHPTRFAQLTLQAEAGRVGEEPALVDLHPLVIGPAEASWPVNGGVLRLPVGCFESSATLEYRGLRLPVPVNPEGMLAQLYGAGWSTPADTWNGRYHTAQVPLVA
jgi:hypothetical protein